MRIGGRRREETGTEAPPPKGPWSDLPSDPAPPRETLRLPFLRRRTDASPSRSGRRPRREPIINNWRGLLIILFLLFVAPWVARWASAVILGLMAGH